MACTLFCRIISARETPSSAVLIAPARVIIIFPPRSRCAMYASAASFNTAALKCRKWRSMNWLMLPIFTHQHLQSVLLDLMQNFQRGSQALIAFFYRNFSRYRSEDVRRQDIRHHTKQKNRRGEQGDCGLFKDVI